jgi:hypothetical protein
MENQNHHQQVCPTIRDLYPTLTESELGVAEASFRRYVQIAAEIQREQAIRGGAFDTVPNPTTMKERSNDNLKS